MWVVKKHTKGYDCGDDEWVYTISEHSTEDEALMAAAAEREETGWPFPSNDSFSVEYE
jgi:hypothetical protein